VTSGGGGFDIDHIEDSVRVGTIISTYIITYIWDATLPPDVNYISPRIMDVDHRWFSVIGRTSRGKGMETDDRRLLADFWEVW
jgi:hypothetical protein